MKQTRRRARKAVTSTTRRFETSILNAHESEDCHGDAGATAQNDQNDQEQMINVGNGALPRKVAAAPSGTSQRQKQPQPHSRGSSTPNNTLLSIIEQRAKKFDSLFLHQLKQEIQELKDRNVWLRVVQHAPHCCFLLQEVFEPIK